MRHLAFVAFALFLSWGLVQSACPARSADRTDCGWVGIDKATCNAKGCCWNSTVPAGVPWCFNPTPAQCSATPVPPPFRTDCGFIGINQTECNGRGCCWNSTVTAGVPWCYNPTPSAPQCSDTSVPPASRIDCGFIGINKTECNGRGCCWNSKVAAGVPWCFKPQPAQCSITPVPPASRVDCGFVGITQTECNGKGCCWDSNVSAGVPWCFNPTTQPAQCSKSPVPTASRTECGFLGITQTECNGKGCCWDSNVSAGVPWCYNPQVARSLKPTR